MGINNWHEEFKLQMGDCNIKATRNIVPQWYFRSGKKLKNSDMITNIFKTLKKKKELNTNTVKSKSSCYQPHWEHALLMSA